MKTEKKVNGKNAINAGYNLNRSVADAESFSSCKFYTYFISFSFLIFIVIVFNYSAFINNNFVRKEDICPAFSFDIN